MSLKLQEICILCADDSDNGSNEQKGTNEAFIHDLNK